MYPGEMPVSGNGYLIRRVALLLVSFATIWAIAAASTPAGARTRAPNRFSTFPQRGGSAPRIVPGVPTSVGPNVNISNETGAQSETSVAIDPTNAKHIYAASNDNLETFQKYNGVYQSTDGGVTWVNDSFRDQAFCYDPWLDFNLSGDVFLSYQCSDQRIAYKKAGQSAWTKIRLTNAGSFPDRDMVRVDRQTGSPHLGSVYIGYDDFGNNNIAYVLHSVNGFSQYQRSQRINDGNPTIGVNVAVGDDGTVYATWEDYSGRKIWTDRSTDGGQTWGRDHLVTNYRLQTGAFFICIPPQNIRCVVPMPFTDAAPAGTTHAGRLYAVYPDKNRSGQDWDTYFRYSDDGGSTWSNEVALNDDGGHAYQFFPAISVAPNGTIAVSFYDTRNDPLSKKVDQYVTFSTNGGQTWSANQRVTTASFSDANGNSNQYGDYEGSDALPGSKARFYLVWTDARRGNLDEDMYGSRVRP
jgi:BNR repeat protein